MGANGTGGPWQIQRRGWVSFDFDALRASVAAKGSLSKQTGSRVASRLGADVWEMTRKLLEADPDDAFAHDALGQFHYQVARLSRIERFLGRVFVGARVMDLGTWEGALTHHRRAVDLEPENIRYRVGLGTVLLDHGDFEEAIVHLEAAVAIPFTTPWDEDFYHQAQRFLAKARREAGSGG